MMGVLNELRIIRDHFHFRLIRRTRPLTIHTECIHRDNVWEAAQRFVNSGKKAIWHVITPANFEFVNAETGCSTDRAAWEKVLLSRYRWLKEHGQKIELHVHLRVKMHLYESRPEAERDAKEKIEHACSWLRSNGFSPAEVVFGWWSCDDFAKGVASRLGLRTVGRLDYYFIHDYDLV